MGAGGKGGGANLGPAINSFQQAYQAVVTNYTRGNDLYQSSIGSATRQALQSYLESNSNNQVFMQSSQDSAGELRKWLGMAPISKVPDLADRLAGADKMAATAQYHYNLLGNLQETVSNLRSIDNYTDPVTRRNLADSVASKLQTAVTGLNREMSTSEGVVKNWFDNTYLKALKDKGTTQAELPKWEDWFAKWAETNTNPSDPSDPLHRYLSPLAMENMNEYNAVLAQRTQVQDVLNQVKSIPDSPEKGWSNEEIVKNLETLPEYQVAFTQGMQALNRSQAARGLLGSGNAMAEATSFGQNLAQSTYQSHLQNLGNLAGITMGAGQTGNQNLINAGQFAAQGISSIGANSQDTLRQIANRHWGNQVGAIQAQAAMQQSQQGASKMGGVGQLAGTLMGGLF